MNKNIFTFTLHRIFRNWFYKLVALSLAAAFWYMIQGKQILEINKKIVANIHTPEGTVVNGPKKILKDATLRGPRVVLGYLKDQDLEANIYIAQSTPGIYRVRINADHFANWDRRAKITVHEAAVNISIDQIADKTVPVRELTKGSPADGYIIENISIQPSSIKISGPKSIVDSIEELNTSLLDITDIQQSKAFQTRVDVSGFESLNLSSDQVVINFQVTEKRVNRSIANVPIEPQGTGYKATFKPGFITIIIQGTPGVLNFVKKNDLRAFVDLEDLRPGMYEKPVKVKIPPETVLIETSPAFTSVVLKEP